MSQPFSFPPPPPPPPTVQRNSPASTDFRGGFRGRGVGRGQYSRGPGQQARSHIPHNDSRQQRARRGGTSVPRTYTPKRDFTTAFHQQPQQRPKAPPAVPSFHADIQNLISKKAVETSCGLTKRKPNSLGLTPAGEIDSESEDDADDEVKLTANSLGEGLQFEHRGQKLSLRTSEEIAAWIAERKRRYPTQAKAAASKREAEERKKQLAAQKEEQRKNREQAQKLSNEARERDRSEKERRQLKDKMIAAQVAKAKAAVAHNKEETALRAKQKAERLRRKAEHAVHELKLAEEQLRLSEQATGSGEQLDIDLDNNLGSEDRVLDDSPFSDGDDTSSSGSSNSSMKFDSEPEEMTSKRTALDRIEPPRAILRENMSDEAPPCKSLLKFGRCKFGKRCRYSHKIIRDKGSKPATGVTRRKGLYQIMVGQEREEEMQHALRTIITLGEKGYLDNTTTSTGPTIPAGIEKSQT